MTTPVANRIEHRLYRRTYQTFPPTVPNPYLLMTPIVANNTNSVVRGANVADYRRRIRSAVSATTSLSGVLYSSSLPPHGYFMCETWNTSKTARTIFEYQGSMCYANILLPDPSSFIISSVKNQVISSFVAKCIQAQTAIRSLVALGEIGDTTRMVNDRSKRIWRGVYDHLRGLKKRLRGVRTLRERGRVVSGSWLEYSFGWIPLASDIDDGIAAISRLRGYRSPRVLVRADSTSSEIISVDDFTQSYFRLGFRVKTVKRRRYGYRLYGSVGISPLSLSGVLQETGVRFSEVVPTLWELIPYSFLVDYFSNVGSIIDAVTFNTSNLLWANYGELKEASLEATSDHYIIPPPAGIEIFDSIVPGPQTFSMSRRHVARNVAPYGSLIPSLEFKIPGVSTKWLNLAALLAARNRLRSELS